MLWSLCSQTPSPFDANATIKVPYQSAWSIRVIDSRAVCGVAAPFTQLRTGYCSRAFFEWVGPFMVRKYLIYALVGPALVLLRSSVLWRRYCHRLGRYQISATDAPVRLSQFEVAVILGAFAPAVLPVALLAFVSNLLASKLALRHFPEALRRGEGGIAQVRYSLLLQYLFVAPLLFSASGCLFLLENHVADSTSGVQLAGAPLLFALLAAVVATPLGHCLCTRSVGPAKPPRGATLRTGLNSNSAHVPLLSNNFLAGADGDIESI